MDSADLVSEILQARCGQLTIAILKGGARLDVYNIAWGRDMGESCDHITTNISPGPARECFGRFFPDDRCCAVGGAGWNLALPSAWPRLIEAGASDRFWPKADIGGSGWAS